MTDSESIADKWETFLIMVDVLDQEYYQVAQKSYRTYTQNPTRGQGQVLRLKVEMALNHIDKVLRIVQQKLNEPGAKNIIERLESQRDFLYSILSNNPIE